VGSNPLYRRRIRFGVFAMVVGIATVMFAATAFADVVEWTGNGTNPDGTCEDVRGDESDSQVWQFNLTGVASEPALLSYSFDDGTTGTDVPNDTFTGNVAKWFVTTDAGAALLSASADATLTGQGRSILTISHCTFAEDTTTTTVEETTTTVEETTTSSAAPTTVEETTTTGVVTTQGTSEPTTAAPVTSGSLPVTGAGETALFAIGIGLFLAGLGLVALERLRVAKTA
jgi:hypothetical protein